MNRTDNFDIRDAVVFVVGVMLGLFMMFFYREISDNKTIARLEAERDSLKMAKQGKPLSILQTAAFQLRLDDCEKEQEEIRKRWATMRLLYLDELREKEMAWEQIAILRMNKRWPPTRSNINR